jgi:probable rRNA maturation factor
MNRIRIFNDHPKHRVQRNETIYLIRHVLKGERQTDAELSIIFTDDKQMLELNGTYLQHWYTTDVISFPLAERVEKKIEGEVYVNLDQARRQTREYSVTVHNEIARLVIHGILHLVGYQDRTKRQKQRMTQLENKYLLPRTREK